MQTNGPIFDPSGPLAPLRVEAGPSDVLRGRDLGCCWEITIKNGGFNEKIWEDL